MKLSSSDTGSNTLSIPNGSISTANTKLFIGGLSYETTDESLGEYFSQFGEVATSVVLCDLETGRSRGFGFVMFTQPEYAQAALNQHHHYVDGRKVESKFAVPRRRASSIPEIPERNTGTTNTQVTNCSSLSNSNTRVSRFSPVNPASSAPHSSEASSPAMGTNSEKSPSPAALGDVVANKIFVGGLRYATSHEALRTYFEQFGEVEVAQVIFNRDTKKSRGFGFVVFSNRSSVEKVLARQKSNPPIIEGKQVEVKTCVSRQEGNAAISCVNSPHISSQVNSLPRPTPYSPMAVSSVQRAPVSTSNSPVVSVKAYNSLNTGNISHPSPVASKDSWGLGSSGAFENNDIIDHINGFVDRRKQATGNVYDSTIFNNSISDDFDRVSGNYSHFSSSHLNCGERVPPGNYFTKARLPTSLPGISSIQKPVQSQEDPLFSLDGYNSQFSIAQSDYPFSLTTESDQDCGLFDMGALSTTISRMESSNLNPAYSANDLKTQFKAPYQGSSQSNSCLPPTQMLFKPSAAYQGNSLTSTPTISAPQSPLFDHSLVSRHGHTFSPYVTNPSSKPIW